MENIIEIKNLCKSFGDIKAVSDLSLRVKKGELFAFLGVNGAGKSTTINVMCGVLPADSGSVLIDGVSPAENPETVRRSFGVVFQSSVLDSALSVRDNLLSRAAFYGIVGAEAASRISALASMLDFKELLQRAVGKLSGGQRRRIDIARALIHSPKILILDEPTTGLDPQTRSLLWSVIESLRRDMGLTVFLTTHYMEEAAEADYAVIIDGGKIAAEGTPLELKNTYTGDYITLYGLDEEQVRRLGSEYEALPDTYRISVSSTAEATKLILSYPELFSDYEVTKGKMDDVFLAVTGRSLQNFEKEGEL